MAIYAIGDVQGYYDPLQRLLAKLNFDPVRDNLWFVGDLVNRGPHSLEVLRFVRDLGDSAITVLGNHDLALLTVAEGLSPLKPKDTFDTVLNAPDAGILLNWLRHRPLLHHDPVLGFTMVHAGLPPQWDLKQAMACAAELEAALRGPEYRTFLAQMYGNEPKVWRAGLKGIERLRFITNCLARLRFCSDAGALSFKEKGPPGSQPRQLKPWFQAPGRRSVGLNIVFGHWAALGYYREPGIYGIESGCSWGNQLTALRLDGREEVLSVDCHRDVGHR